MAAVLEYLHIMGVMLFWGAVLFAAGAAFSTGWHFTGWLADASRSWRARAARKTVLRSGRGQAVERLKEAFEDRRQGEKGIGAFMWARPDHALDAHPIRGSAGLRGGVMRGAARPDDVVMSGVGPVYLGMDMADGPDWTVHWVPENEDEDGLYSPGGIRW